MARPIMEMKSVNKSDLIGDGLGSRLMSPGSLGETDVGIRFLGTNFTIPAHSCVLKAASRKFKRRINSARRSADGKITLFMGPKMADYRRAMECLVLTFYDMKPRDLQEAPTLLSVLNLADQYGAKDTYNSLKQIWLDDFLDMTESEDPLELYFKCNEMSGFKQSCVKDRCNSMMLKLIIKNLHRYWHSEEWYGLDEEAVKIMLQDDDLNLLNLVEESPVPVLKTTTKRNNFNSENEATIFFYIYRWIQYQKTTPEYDNDLPLRILQFVRVGLMSRDDFYDVTTGSQQILSTTELSFVTARHIESVMGSDDNNSNDVVRPDSVARNLPNVLKDCCSGCRSHTYIRMNTKLCRKCVAVAETGEIPDV